MTHSAGSDAVISAAGVGSRWQSLAAHSDGLETCKSAGPTAEPLRHSCLNNSNNCFTQHQLLSQTEGAEALVVTGTLLHTSKLLHGSCNAF